LARRYCQIFSTGFSSGARGQEDRGDVAGDVEFVGCVPPGAVEQQDGVSVLGDVLRDFLKMELHRLGVGEGHRQRGANASRGADGAEEIGAFIALVSGLTWPRSAPGPLAHEPVLLADAGLILEPDLDRRGLRQAVEMSAQRAREVFLYASTIRSS